MGSLIFSPLKKQLLGGEWNFSTTVSIVSCLRQPCMGAPLDYHASVHQRLLFACGVVYLLYCSTQDLTLTKKKKLQPD